MKIDPNNPFQLIPLALSTDAASVVALPIYAPATPTTTLVIKAKNRTQRIPPELAAKIAAESPVPANGNGNGSSHPDTPTHIEVGRLLLTIPADIADNLNGPESERHPVYLMIVHRGMYDAAVRQAETGIVLAGPGSMPQVRNHNPNRPIIVKP